MRLRTLNEECQKHPPRTVWPIDACPLLSALRVPKQPWKDVAETGFHVTGREGEELGLSLVDSGQER